MTPGTVVILHTGSVITEQLHWVRSLPSSVRLLPIAGHQIARQRNMGVEASVGDWVLFFDSDCVPVPGMLDALLAHDVPIVSAVVLERFPPWRTTAVRSLDPPERWLLPDLPRTGLMAVTAVGAGCLLIRREVFAALGGPFWFRCGQIRECPDLLLEDTEFCLRASEAGFPITLDCGLRVGHRVQGSTVWPGRDGRPWVQYGGPGDTRLPLDISVATGGSA